MRFENRVYDVLKWICLIFLPAVAVLYSAVDGVFGWGYTATVTTIISAVETFLGSMIGISTKSYNKKNDEPCLEDNIALYTSMSNEGSSTC